MWHCVDSKPRLFPNKLSRWPPCNIVLTLEPVSFFHKLSRWPRVTLCWRVARTRILLTNWSTVTERKTGWIPGTTPSKWAMLHVYWRLRVSAAIQWGRLQIIWMLKSDSTQRAFPSDYITTWCSDWKLAKACGTQRGALCTRQCPKKTTKKPHTKRKEKKKKKRKRKKDKLYQCV